MLMKGRRNDQRHEMSLPRIGRKIRRCVTKRDSPPFSFPPPLKTLFLFVTVLDSSNSLPSNNSDCLPNRVPCYSSLIPCPPPPIQSLIWRSVSASFLDFLRLENSSCASSNDGHHPSAKLRILDSKRVEPTLWLVTSYSPPVHTRLREAPDSHESRSHG
jgi:hypothetical protein